MKSIKPNSPYCFTTFSNSALIVLMIFFTLYAMYRIVPNPGIDKLSRTTFQSSQSTYQMKRLIDEVRELLTQVIHTNVTLSSESINNLKKLNIVIPTKEKVEVNNECEKVITHMKSNLDQCTIDNSQLKKQLHVVNPVESQPITSVDNSLKWLVIGIPTVPRIHNEDYLLSTLESISKQLPVDPSDILYNQILIMVINVQGDTSHPHTAFNAARLLYEGSHSKAIYFQFIELTSHEIIPDPIPHRNAINDPGTPNKPGYLVRKQTRSIVSVIQKSYSKGKFYLFLEDDMQLCPHGFHVIQYLLSKSSRYHPDWLAIRASYGMNGIFLHDKDLLIFANYLLTHQIRRPPDHLVVEWYAGETSEASNYKKLRLNIGFKFNLFDHIGVVSTLRSAKQTSFPTCYEHLLEPTVFKVEAFSLVDCPLDDIWPCNVDHPDHNIIDWSKTIRKK